VNQQRKSRNAARATITGRSVAGGGDAEDDYKTGDISADGEFSTKKGSERTHRERNYANRDAPLK
jgi:hypothetical protein